MKNCSAPVSSEYHLQGRDVHCSIQYDNLRLARYETTVVVKILVLTPALHFGKAKTTAARKS